MTGGAWRGSRMTDDTDHPTYPNPTIVEAVCQVDFEPPPDSGWQIGRPAEFLRLVSAEYPYIEPIPGPVVTISVGQAGEMPQFLPRASALKLSVDTKTRYIAIGDKHFAFGHVAPYPGWNVFRTHLLGGWTKFVDVAKISQITRASLRYINVIPRTAEHPLISDWLKSTDTVPEALIRSQLDPLVLRVETWLDPTSLLVVTVGTAVTSGPVPSILFDIQRTSAVVAGAAPVELIHHIDSLHNDVWRQFSSVKTPLLDAHLKVRSK
jgi:uncharacterized protein (TIGR04255 family)